MGDGMKTSKEKERNAFEFDLGRAQRKGSIGAPKGRMRNAS